MDPNYLLFFKKSGILICISLFAAGRKEGVVLSCAGAAGFSAGWLPAFPALKVGAALNLGMVYPVVCCVFGVNVRLNAGCAGFVKVGAAVSVAAASFEALFSAGCAL